MIRIAMILSAFVFLATGVYADSGVISIKSNHSVTKTADRLVNILETKGMKIFNRIDHSAGARGVGISLRPTQLVVFGNPKVGAPLMQCSQRMGIDLPQKALIWEDENGGVWLTYNDPDALAARHQISGCDEVLTKVRTALDNFATAATKP